MIELFKKKKVKDNLKSKQERNLKAFNSYEKKMRKMSTF